MQKVSHVAVDDTTVGGCRFEYGKHIIMLNICVYVMLNIYVKHITMHVISMKHFFQDFLVIL